MNKWKNAALKCVVYCAVSMLSVFSFSSVGFSESLEKSIQNVYAKEAPFLRVVTNEKDYEKCILTTLPETEIELARDLLMQCGLRVKAEKAPTKTTIFIYSKNAISETKDFLYTKYDGSLLMYVRTFFKDWELRGQGVNEVFLVDKWRKLSIEELFQEIASSWRVELNYKDQRMYVFDKKIDKSGDLKFGIFLPFDDRNRDIYELVKGYLTVVSVVKYSRDGKDYLLISEPESTREKLSKTYSFIKASLRQRWMKSVRLGGYFPDLERDRLKLLYLLINSSEIKAFVGNELEGIQLTTLTSQGFDKYTEEIAKVEEKDIETLRSTKLPEYLPTSKTTETTVQQQPRQREAPKGPVVEKMDPTKTTKSVDSRIQSKLDALKNQ